MRPNTRESGIFRTNRNSPVNTSMLTRMLVPKPKNAFQSPALQSVGRKPQDVVLLISPSPSPQSPAEARSGGLARLQRGQQRLRSGHRTENAALGLDHGQARLVEFREIRRAAIRQHDAAEAAIVGLAHRGVDADLGGHAADEQRVDAAVL